MKTLYLSQVSEDFDPVKDIALSPRCFLDREDILERFPDLKFVAPLDDPELQLEESLKAADFANMKIKEWAAVMNTTHGCSYSVGYWRVLLMSWLFNMIIVCRKRYREIETFIEIEGSSPLSVPLYDEDMNWNLKDGPEIWSKGLRNPIFDYWLTSVVVKEFAPENWNFKPVSGLFNTAETYDLEPLLENRNIVSKLPGMSSTDQALLSSWVKVISLFKNNKVEKISESVSSIKHNYSARFEGIVDYVLAKTLPEPFKDQFDYYNGSFEKMDFLKNRVCVPHTGHLHHGVSHKFEVAHAFEKGEKIVCHQHGSGYGMSKNFILFREIEYSFSRYLSWGWTKQDHMLEDAIPIASPKLSKFLDLREPKHNNKLILIGTEIPPTANRLNSEPESVGFLRYRKMKTEFMGALDKNVLDDFWYRPFPAGLGRFDDKEYVMDHFKNLNILEGSLNAQMVNSKLVVHDYPGTASHISLVSDTPTVCYWEADSWSYCDEAQPFLKMLKSCGLYHETAESAAQHINEIWDDVEGWWNSRDVLDARKIWKNTHARSNKWWQLEWLSVLWKINREPNRRYASWVEVPLKKVFD